MPREVFEVSVDGFSGPLDLLCHLVESRQMQASRIKVAHLVRIYGAYLARTRSASAETIAEFFFMAAGLLLEKTRSLLPESAPDAGMDIEDPEPDVDEEALLETLARYRPYREAARWLWERREREMRYFRRVVEEDEAPEAPRPEELEYDIGDLYFLSRVWWGLFERCPAAGGKPHLGTRRRTPSGAESPRPFPRSPRFRPASESSRIGWPGMLRCRSARCAGRLNPSNCWW